MSNFDANIEFMAVSLLQAQLEACRDELQKLSALAERLKVCLLCTHANIIGDVGWCGMRDEWTELILPDDLCHLSPSCWKEITGDAEVEH